MRKRKEVTDPKSCLNRAFEDELIFVLLARDPAAPVAIQAWIEKRIELGLNTRDDPKLTEAQNIAVAMFKEQASVLGSSLQALQWKKESQDARANQEGR